MTEEDFVMLFSKKVGDEEHIEEGLDAVCQPSANHSVQEVPEDDGSPSIRDIRHLVKVYAVFFSK